MFHRLYEPGQYPPERGANHDWHVWCHKGALEVLATQEWRQALGDPARLNPYGINFANGGHALLTNVDLWQALVAIQAEGFRVQVYPLWPAREWRWLEAQDPVGFDCIRIWRQDQITYGSDGWPGPSDSG